MFVEFGKIVTNRSIIDVKNNKKLKNLKVIRTYHTCFLAIINIYF